MNEELQNMGLQATPPVEPVQPTPQPEPPVEPQAPAPQPETTPEGESYERLKERAKFYQTEHQKLLDSLKTNNPDALENYKQEALKRRRGVEPQPVVEDPNEDYEARLIKLAQQGVRQEFEQARLRDQVEADAREGERMWKEYVQSVQPSEETIQQATEYVRRFYGIDFYSPGGPQRVARAIFDVIAKMDLSAHLNQQATLAAAQAAAKAKEIVATAVPEGQPIPPGDNRPKTAAQKELDKMGLFGTNVRTP